MKWKQALLGSNLPGLIQSDSIRNVVDNLYLPHFLLSINMHSVLCLKKTLVVKSEYKQKLK